MRANEGAINHPFCLEIAEKPQSRAGVSTGRAVGGDSPREWRSQADAGGCSPTQGSTARSQLPPIPKLSVCRCCLRAAQVLHRPGRLAGTLLWGHRRPVPRVCFDHTLLDLATTSRVLGCISAAKFLAPSLEGEQRSERFVDVYSAHCSQILMAQSY